MHTRSPQLYVILSPGYKNCEGPELSNIIHLRILSSTQPKDMSYHYGYTAPPPPPPPPPYLVPAHPAAATPTHQQLVQAAREFSQWLQSVAPGATAFICGGLALAMHGNARSTTVSYTIPTTYT